MFTGRFFWKNLVTCNLENGVSPDVVRHACTEMGGVCRRTALLQAVRRVELESLIWLKRTLARFPSSRADVPRQVPIALRRCRRWAKGLSSTSTQNISSLRGHRSVPKTLPRCMCGKYYDYFAQMAMDCCAQRCRPGLKAQMFRFQRSAYRRPGRD